MKKFNFKNPKGISVLFLVIAMMLMITIGYVFSYLIPTKQKSVIFPIQSTQAFYLAQSGVEYAIRYATVNRWLTTAALNTNLNTAANSQRTLVAPAPGRFTISYTPDILTSVGEVPSGTVNEKRRIIVTNFSSFLRQLVLRIDPNATPAYPPPCLYDTTGNDRYEARFYIWNVGSTALLLNSFRASWVPRTPTDRVIDRVRFGTTTRYNLSYINNGARTYFNTGTGGCTAPNCTYSIAANTTVQVRIRFADLPAFYNFSSLVVYLYDTNNNMYTFILDPDHDGLPTC